MFVIDCSSTHFSRLKNSLHPPLHWCLGCSLEYQVRRPLLLLSDLEVMEMDLDAVD
jgi:hypothetical protein